MLTAGHGCRYNILLVNFMEKLTAASSKVSVKFAGKFYIKDELDNEKS